MLHSYYWVFCFFFFPDPFCLCPLIDWTIKTFIENYYSEVLTYYCTIFLLLISSCFHRFAQLLLLPVVFILFDLLTLLASMSLSRVSLRIFWNAGLVVLNFLRCSFLYKYLICPSVLTQVRFGSCCLLGLDTLYAKPSCPLRFVQRSLLLF